jgi:hypothetical protein
MAWGEQGSSSAGSDCRSMSQMLAAFAVPFVCLKAVRASARENLQQKET